MLGSWDHEIMGYGKIVGTYGTIAGNDGNTHHK
jgi:hypothetical protein